MLAFRHTRTVTGDCDVPTSETIDERRFPNVWNTDDQVVGYRLAATGAIKDDILNIDDIALFALRELKTRYPEQLRERYRLDEVSGEAVDVLEAIGKKRGFVSGGYVDFERTSEMLLHELRTEKLGRVTLETVEEWETNE